MSTSRWWWIIHSFSKCNRILRRLLKQETPPLLLHSPPLNKLRAGMKQWPSPQLNERQGNINTRCLYRRYETSIPGGKPVIMSWLQQPTAVGTLLLRCAIWAPERKHKSVEYAGHLMCKALLWEEGKCATLDRCLCWNYWTGATKV